MNKIDLIQTLSTTNDISKVEAAKLVSIFFDQMASTLEKGDRVEIRGLFSFYVKDYEGYTHGLKELIPPQRFLIQAVISAESASTSRRFTSPNSTQTHNF